MHRHICLFDCILFFPCNCFTLRKNRFRGSGSPFRVGVGCHSQSFTTTKKKLPFQIYHVHICHPSLRTKNFEELDSWNFNSKRSDVRQRITGWNLSNVCLHTQFAYACWNVDKLNLFIIYGTKWTFQWRNKCIRDLWIHFRKKTFLRFEWINDSSLIIPAFRPVELQKHYKQKR